MFSHLRTPNSVIERKTRIKEHAYRTPFMRDRDRILYSKAFRRLSGKTQIFVTSYDDHARTRLTHSLEVAQIAKTIARKLHLDEDLAEAMALGHDLGHTPFGHVGERVLNSIMNHCFDFVDELSLRGFKHNLQSLRVTQELEKGYEGRGLNLTLTTLFGLFAHTNADWEKYNPCKYSTAVGKEIHCNMPLVRTNCRNEQKLSVTFYDKHVAELLLPDGDTPWSVEAYVVKFADEIAQRHHDLEDGLIAKLISPVEVLEMLNDLKPKPPGIQL